MTDPKIIIPVGAPTETIIVPTGETPEAKIAREAAEEAQRLIDEAKPKPGDPDYVDPNAAPAPSPLPLADEIQTIEITGEDNVVSTFTLDKDGNAVDDKGTIVYTAAKLLELGGDQPADEDQFEAISILSGIKLLNPDGTPKTYENTVEGFAKREIDVKTLAIQEGANLGVQNFLASNPELADMYDYKRMYGSLDNYTSFVDYSKITIDPAKKDLMIDLIYKAEIQKGTSADRAKRIANFSVADDTLVADSTEALGFLQTAQVSKVTERAARENAALAKEIEQENMYFGVAYDDKGKEVILNVKDSIYDIVVNEGKVGNIVIPKEGLIVKQPDGTAKNFTRKQIFDYISIPVKEINGEYVTQAQLDEMKRLADKSQLVSSYIRNLLGGDISQLVEAAKLKDKATTVRKLVIKSGSSVNKGSDGTKGKPIIVVK